MLDHYVQPATGSEVYVPMRVVANQGGAIGDGSEVLFTMFRTPDMDDERGAADARFVERDLEHLRAVLGGCSIGTAPVDLGEPPECPTRCYA